MLSRFSGTFMTPNLVIGKVAESEHKIYESGHAVPMVEVIKESVAWFDRHLGPVGEGTTTSRPTQTE